MGVQILLISNDADVRTALVTPALRAGHRVTELSQNEFSIGDLSTAPLRSRAWDLVVLDAAMTRAPLLTVVRALKATEPQVSIVILTSRPSLREAVELMREGAQDYVEKPWSGTACQELLTALSEARALAQGSRLSAPTLTLGNGEQFIGSSKEMKTVFEIIQRLAQVTTSVLIRGESGTGKELVARAIHFNSPRRDRPFVAVNCGAIPENLIESELFGHEKGAFTGADQRHVGKFQFAEGGTLFLDEIGDISPALQVKLLRVLQERKFIPVGANHETSCDVRVIAATNRNLEQMIESGQFRQDLFYRLNVMPVFLPPLRDRLSDIPVLVDHFVARFNELHGRTQSGREIHGIRPDALRALQAYHWPGNIRELENIIERAFVLENDDWISVASLPDYLSQGTKAPEFETALTATASLSDDDFDFHRQREQFEREFIIRALRQFNGRINQTVARAGIPKNTLLRKIRKYGIQTSEADSR